MEKILVSASHYDTLCQDAWRLLEESGYQVIFDPEKKFPAYTTEEIAARDDREKIVAAVIGNPETVLAAIGLNQISHVSSLEGYGCLAAVDYGGHRFGIRRTHGAEPFPLWYATVSGDERHLDTFLCMEHIYFFESGGRIGLDFDYRQRIARKFQGFCSGNGHNDD